jgi:hypothetical protein
MADDRPEDTETSADLGRPKRAPPTLDLEATEVSEKPPAEAMGTADTGAKEGELPPEPRPRAPRSTSILIPALSGAIAAALVLAVVWLVGWPGQAAAPEADHAAVDAVAARVATLESKVSAPSSAAPDAATANRFDALEKSLASLREELAAQQSRSDRLAAAMNELKLAPRDAAAPPDLSALDQRLTQLEHITGAQMAEAAQQSAKPADDKPLRRIVAAALLDVSVRQGEPFPAALQAAKALAPDPSALKPLETFAATGVPNPSALSRDLLALLPKAAPAPETTAATGAGIVDRLEAGAARLVRIQRTDAGDATGGSDRSAVVVRAAAAAQRNDIAGARRELNSLSPSDRAAVQSGLDQLDARDAALTASRQFAADAMAALSKPAP